MGWFSVIFAASTALLISIVTFYALSKTILTTNMKIFIIAKPEDVFNYAKDPNNLPEMQYTVLTVRVQKLEKDLNGKEHREYIMEENIQHVGPHMFQVHSTADQTLLRISTSTVYLYGLVEAHVVWKFVSSYDDEEGMQGTLMSERSEILVPQALRRFFNRTIEASHRQTLLNIKYVLEMEGEYSVQRTLPTNRVEQS